jgi:hypothetical protein
MTWSGTGVDDPPACVDGLGDVLGIGCPCGATDGCRADCCIACGVPDPLAAVDGRCRTSLNDWRGDAEPAEDDVRRVSPCSSAEVAEARRCGDVGEDGVDDEPGPMGVVVDGWIVVSGMAALLAPMLSVGDFVMGYLVWTPLSADPMTLP